jgi:hypothetical protein
MVFSTRKTEKIMKMKQYILGCMTVAVVFGCSVASVKADDIYPPAWTRGATNTTYQEWNFGTSANPAAPGVAYNPNGTPTATITGGIWSFIYDNHVGVWTLGASDSIDLSIPNTPLELNNTKDIWTQVTWQGDLGGSPVVTVDYGSTGLESIVSTLQFTAPVGTGRWLQSVYLARLPFNPASENVIVTGTIDVGQVVIDTQCIPEPSSLALLALGAISLLSYASRKR